MEANEVNLKGHSLAHKSCSCEVLDARLVTRLRHTNVSREALSPEEAQSSVVSVDKNHWYAKALAESLQSAKKSDSKSLIKVRFN